MWEAEKEKSGKKKWIIIIVVVVLCCLCTAGVCVGVGYVASTEGWFDDIFGGGDGKDGDGEGGDGDKLPYCPQQTTKPDNLPAVTALDFSKSPVSYSTKTARPGFTPEYAWDNDDKTCHLSVTNTDFTPIWRLDMEEVYVITSVAVVGTNTYETQQNNDMEVRVGNRIESPHEQMVGPVNSNTLCDEKPGMNTVYPTVFTCPKMLYGRYLTVQKVKPCTDCHNHPSMAICTIKINGYKLPLELIE